MTPSIAQSQPIRVLMLGAGLDVQGGITSVEKLMLDYAPPELEIFHVATFVKGSTLRNLRIYLGAMLRLIGMLWHDQVDLVHIHFSDRGSTLRKLILAAIVLMFHKSFILHCHGAAYREFYAKVPTWAKRMIVAVFSQCAQFIALSESWRDYYAKIFALTPDQITVMPNPVILPSTIPDRHGRQVTTFVFLGRIGAHGGALDMMRSVISFPRQDKGCFDLIRAFAALPPIVRDQARLVLAGNGDVEKAESLIQELGLTDSVRVHSWLDAAQRDRLLAEADAFVLPSYNEGLPMSMLEAMAWQLPVIVTPVGGIPEVIQSGVNGLLVQPGQQSELVEAMCQIVLSEAIRMQIGKAARETVKQLDVNQYMKEMLISYRLIVSH
ncbi:MAG: glycosyltransferase family 4 protein [Elainella sp. Prado103]|nr:glycosyltransferase family 4 protein [Elainella sp. Prado103]